MTKTTLTIDPVCGMDVDVSTATLRADYKEQTYYFCGATCKQKFDMRPDEYTSTSAGAAKSDKGCCG